MAVVPNLGLLDLEKDLTCSICTEVLYQPLTLLDCLHSFCGSCLKEWFSFAVSSQRHTSSSSNNAPSYTCPSCRAVVRETRPNATVTTLLDKLLQAHPALEKSDAEKAEIAASYKPGDEVLPKRRERERVREDPRGRRGRGHRTREAAVEELDRRLVEEVREMSLREAQNSSRPQRLDQNNSRPREVSATVSAQPSQESTRSRMEHQSSLRSLLSVSRRASVDDLDSQEMEEEIIRQIVEDNVLAGIDLTNINEAQEEEISNRIAEAYLRRQRNRTNRPAGQSPRRLLADNQNPQAHSSRQTEQQSRARPPVSRPHLLDDVVDRHHRRSHSQGTTRSVTSQDSRRASAENIRALPTTVDLPTTAEPSSSRALRSQEAVPTRNTQVLRNSRERRSTDSDQPRISELWQRRGARGIPPVGTAASSPRDPIRSDTSNLPALGSPRADFINHAQPSPNHAPSTRSVSLPSVSTFAVANTLPAQQTKIRPALYFEPIIACDRCGRDHIQYQLHYACPYCNSGNYHLCLQCYRQGKGCLHWYGFGFSAWQAYQRRAPPNGYPEGYEGPHILQPQQFHRPRKPLLHLADPAHPSTTNENPMHRLQRGAFCANCLSNADLCYWQCDWCNDGDWGFCNSCVNQGHCCMHPLKARICQFFPHSPAFPGANTETLQPQLFPILPAPTCNHCNKAISAATPHFHCPSKSTLCHSGDYDVHIACYEEMRSSGQISGDIDKRLCPNGHRMQVVGFVDENNVYPEGDPVGELRRVIVEDVAGGWALGDDDDSGNIPGSNPAGTDTEKTAHNRNDLLTWTEDDGSVRRLQRGRSPLSPPPADEQRNSSSNAGTNSNTNAADSESQAQGSDPTPTPARGRCISRWSWWPDSAFGVMSPGNADESSSAGGASRTAGTGTARSAQEPTLAPGELAFPKGADIREVIDVNGDWYEGIYCRRRGVFPAGLVHFVG